MDFGVTKDVSAAVAYNSVYNVKVTKDVVLRAIQAK